MRRSSLVTAVTAAACATALVAVAGQQPVGAAPAPGAVTRTATTATTTMTSAAVTYRALDPATWSAGQLGAQLTFACVDVADTSAQRSLAAAGIGGIGFLGNDAPSDLRTRLASVRAAAPHGIPPMIASDEEGGLVQRLADVIYPLPSAETMGTWSTTRIRSTAYHYAQHMRALGVVADFGPVADLGIPGYFIASEHRAFSRWPDHVAADVTAWIHGMRSATVLTTVKHWPGHGQASNTHTGAATIPPLSTLETRDMIPFNAAFALHVPMVMVGHLMSEGLTEPGWPASESPHALAYLRHKAGYGTLLVTDSLSMAAASTAVHLTVPQAAVRAISSGADIALACEPSGVASAVGTAIGNGTISRAKAVASARRLLRLKAHEGVLPTYTGPWQSSVQLKLGRTTVAAGGTATMSTTATGGYRPVHVQEYRDGAWHTVRVTTSGEYGWCRVSLPTGVAGTHRFRSYVPAAFPYASVTSAAVTLTVTS